MGVAKSETATGYLFAAAPSQRPVTVISATDLSKRYGDVLALDRVDLTVDSGETFGFLGPNGAGKSTFIDILLGFVAPSDGTLSVFGHDCQDDGVAVRERLGILPEGYAPFDALSGRQHVEYAIRSKGVNENPADVLARVGLRDDAARPAADYSKGMCQRLALSMPHGRSTLVLGRFVGRAGVLSAATVVVMAIAGVLVVYPYGTLQPLRFLAFVLLTVGHGATWVGIGVAASALVATNRRALVLGVVALFVFVIVWDAATAGAEAGLVAAGITDGPIRTAVRVSAQLGPGSAFETLVTALAVSDQGPDAWYNGPALALPVLVGWLLGPLSVAIVRFEWRDLA